MLYLLLIARRPDEGSRFPDTVALIVLAL